MRLKGGVAPVNHSFAALTTTDTLTFKALESLVQLTSGVHVDVQAGQM